MPGHMDKMTDDAMMAETDQMMQNPIKQMPEESRRNLMMPSEEITAVLVSRIANMTEEELTKLDSAITPEVARILIKLLPELAELIRQVANRQPTQQREMGALGSM